MKKFDIFTPIGIFVGLTLVLFAIFINSDRGMSDVVYFIQISSILIVIGGLTAAILINFSVADLKLVPKVFAETFRSEPKDLPHLINTFVNLSTRARREGLLALEAQLEEVDDPFIQKGVLLAVDGIEPDIIKDIMMAEVVAMEERHRKGRAIIEKSRGICTSLGNDWNVSWASINVTKFNRSINTWTKYGTSSINDTLWITTCKLSIYSNG